MVVYRLSKATLDTPIRLDLGRVGRAALSLALAGTLSGALAGCDTTLGVLDGSDLSNSAKFDGVSSANALSPTAVRVTWNTSSDYGNYQVFSSSSPFPLGQTIFSSFTVTGLSALTTYSFSVGGIHVSTNKSEGLQRTLQAQTWPQFTGISQLTASNPSSLQASWSFKDSKGNPISGPTFNVYVAAGAPPSDFTNPAVSTTLSTVGISQLADGTPITGNTTYYAIVRATYLDGTAEYNGNALSAKTPSNISPLPTVSSDAVIIGAYPNITVSGGLSGYQTAFKLVTPPLGPKTLGTTNGNSTWRAPNSQPLGAGQNEIVPIVSYQGSSVELPSVNIVSRSLKDTMIDFPALHAVPGPSGTPVPRGYQHLGSALAVGDFNCDGYQDLAVSAAFANINPLMAQAAKDGGVYVYYGSASGLVTSPAPAAIPQSPGAPLLLSRPNVSGPNWGAVNFGWALAAGNLNGDVNPSNVKACDDLAIGEGSATANEVFVYFGSPGGLQYAGSPVSNGNACSGTSCSPLRVVPPAGSYTASPFFGYSLAIGKLHKPSGGDTYQDLIVGGPAEQVAGRGRGTIYIFYGGSAGIDFVNPPPFGSTGKEYTKIDAPADVGGAPAWAYNFGQAVAAQDMDGDSIDDIQVGAPITNTHASFSALGAVYYYGSISNNLAAGNFYPAAATSTLLQNPVNIAAAGAVNLTRFGGWVAGLGDVNGDGFGDLGVADGNHDQYAFGTVTHGITVFYGSPTGPQTANGCATMGTYVGNSSPACSTSSTSTCVYNGPGLASTCKVLKIPYSGSATTVNPANVWSPEIAGANAGGGQDVNGDGFHDFIVGWPVCGYASEPCKANVYYGSQTGIQVANSKIQPLVTTNYDNFGMGVALGKFNTDPYSDVAAAAPDNVSLNGPFGGAVFEYNGQNGGLPSIVSSYTAMLTPNASKEGLSGSSFMPIGDINGDGYSDAAAVIYRPTATRTNTYILYTDNLLIIYYGSANGLVTSPTPSLTPAANGHPLLVPYPVPGGITTFTLVGGVGDVNGDGFNDLVTSNGQTAWLFYGSSTGLQVSVAPAVPPTVGLNPVTIAQSDGTSGSVAGVDILTAFPVQQGISSGDFNGDGYSDIGMGSATAFSGQGASVVVYGSATGPQTDGTLARTTAGGAEVLLTDPCTGTIPNLTCKAQLLLGPSPAETYFANLVAGARDVNGDGYDDFLASSPNNNAEGVGAGAVYLFYGSPKGLTTWQGAAVGLRITPQKFNAAMVSRYFGRAMASVGDVNGDGFADFAVSSLMENGQYGGAYLYYGCGNGMNSSAATANCPVTGVWGVPNPPSVTQVANVVVNQPSCTASGCSVLFFYPSSSSVIAMTGASAYSYWGYGVGGVGDVNKDGKAEVLLSTHYISNACSSTACPTSTVLVGGAVLFSGSETGLVVNQGVSRAPSCSQGACSPYWAAPSMTNWGINKPAHYHYGFGTSWGYSGTSDFNGDGYLDFAISSQAYLNAAKTTSFSGGFYVFE